MPARRATQLYLLHLSLAGAGLALLVGAGIVLMSGLELRLPSTEEIARACDSWLASGGPGALLALATAALASISVLLGLRSGWRQVGRARRYLRALPLADEPALIDGQHCAVIDAARPQAFCAGFLRPRIYLSHGALERLSPQELRAVVAHERHHLRRRDPLRVLLARVLADALFFVPLLRPSTQRYEVLGELAADEAAVRRVEARGPLASALIKFGSPDCQPPPIVGIAPERVDHLLGDSEAARWRLPRSLAGRSAIALTCLAVLFALSWQISPGPELPLVLAAGCMVGMIGGPILLAALAVKLSRSALRAGRT